MNGKKVRWSGNNIFFIRYIIDLFPYFFYKIKIGLTDSYFFIKKKKMFFFEVLKKHFQFQQLIDIFVLDFLNKKQRFELFYSLMSLFLNFRIFIIIPLKDFEGIFSLFSLYKSSNWLEREVWDMFGIFFYANPDLRRILTDYGFLGHPLRKDFPLSGFIEVFYDDEQKAVLSLDVEHSQEYRLQGSINPWSKLIDYT